MKNRIDFVNVEWETSKVIDNHSNLYAKLKQWRKERLKTFQA